jgi:hypothetical protein
LAPAENLSDKYRSASLALGLGFVPKFMFERIIFMRHLLRELAVHEPIGLLPEFFVPRPVIDP